MGKKSRRNRNKTGGIRTGSGATIPSNDNNDNREQLPFRRTLHAQKGGTFRIRVDFDGPENGTIYSYGNYLGGAEFIAFGVPSTQFQDVVKVIQSLSVNQEMIKNLTNPVHHGQSWWLKTDRFPDKYLVTKLIGQGPNKEELLKKHGITDGIQNPLFELVPRFQHKDRPKNWGGIKSAPENREDIATAILDIWDGGTKQFGENFTLYIDGDKSNDAFTNKKCIDASTSLKHIDDWVVNWDDNLTAEQASFVRTYNRYFSHVTKVLFRPIKICDTCGLMDKERLVRCVCKCAWYCSPECQVAAWPNHKERCKRWRLLYNNRPIEMCAECGQRDTKKLRLCSRCQTTWYCCEEHQKSHWPSHKQCCKQKRIVID